MGGIGVGVGGAGDDGDPPVTRKQKKRETNEHICLENGALSPPPSRSLQLKTLRVAPAHSRALARAVKGGRVEGRWSH